VDLERLGAVHATRHWIGSCLFLVLQAAQTASSSRSARRRICTLCARLPGEYRPVEKADSGVSDRAGDFRNWRYRSRSKYSNFTAEIGDSIQLLRCDAPLRNCTELLVKYRNYTPEGCIREPRLILLYLSPCLRSIWKLLLRWQTSCSTNMRSS